MLPPHWRPAALPAYDSPTPTTTQHLHHVLAMQQQQQQLLVAQPPQQLQQLQPHHHIIAAPAVPPMAPTAFPTPSTTTATLIHPSLPMAPPVATTIPLPAYPAAPIAAPLPFQYIPLIVAAPPTIAPAPPPSVPVAYAVHGPAHLNAPVVPPPPSPPPQTPLHHHHQQFPQRSDPHAPHAPGYRAALPACPPVAVAAAAALPDSRSAPATAPSSHAPVLAAPPITTASSLPLGATLLPVSIPVAPAHTHPHPAIAHSTQPAALPEHTNICTPLAFHPIDPHAPLVHPYYPAHHPLSLFYNHPDPNLPAIPIKIQHSLPALHTPATISHPISDPPSIPFQPLNHGMAVTHQHYQHYLADPYLSQAKLQPQGSPPGHPLVQNVALVASLPAISIASTPTTHPAPISRSLDGPGYHSGGYAIIGSSNPTIKVAQSIPTPLPPAPAPAPIQIPTLSQVSTHPPIFTQAPVALIRVDTTVAPEHPSIQQNHQQQGLWENSGLQGNAIVAQQHHGSSSHISSQEPVLHAPLHLSVAREGVPRQDPQPSAEELQIIHSLASLRKNLPRDAPHHHTPNASHPQVIATSASVIVNAASHPLAVPSASSIRFTQNHVELQAHPSSTFTALTQSASQDGRLDLPVTTGSHPPVPSSHPNAALLQEWGATDAIQHHTYPDQTLTGQSQGSQMAYTIKPADKASSGYALSSSLPSTVVTPITMPPQSSAGSVGGDQEHHSTKKRRTLASVAPSSSESVVLSQHQHLPIGHSISQPPPQYTFVSMDRVSSVPPAVLVHDAGVVVNPTQPCSQPVAPAYIQPATIVGSSVAANQLHPNIPQYMIMPPPIVDTQVVAMATATMPYPAQYYAVPITQPPLQAQLHSIPVIAPPSTIPNLVPTPVATNGAIPPPIAVSLAAPVNAGVIMHAAIDGPSYTYVPLGPAAPNYVPTHVPVAMTMVTTALPLVPQSVLPVPPVPSMPLTFAPAQTVIALDSITTMPPPILTAPTQVPVLPLNAPYGTHLGAHVDHPYPYPAPPQPSQYYVYPPQSHPEAIPASYVPELAHSYSAPAATASTAALANDVTAVAGQTMLAHDPHAAYVYTTLPPSLLMQELSLLPHPVNMDTTDISGTYTETVAAVASPAVAAVTSGSTVATPPLDSIPMRKSYSAEIRPDLLLGKRRARPPKERGAPKHPMSAFLFYLSEVRPRYTAKYPGSTVSPISKMISTSWHAMNDEQKSKYIAKANVDKERYAKEMGEWMRIKTSKFGPGAKVRVGDHGVVNVGHVARAAIMTTTAATAAMTKSTSVESRKRDDGGHAAVVSDATVSLTRTPIAMIAAAAAVPSPSVTSTTSSPLVACTVSHITPDDTTLVSSPTASVSSSTAATTSSVIDSMLHIDP